MKKLIMLACMGVMFVASNVAIANSQHDRMRFCNKDAKVKALKGDERRAFMKQCLRKKKVLSAKEKAAEKVADAKKKVLRMKKKSCKKTAKKKGLKSDKRKVFVSECMKG